MTAYSRDLFRLTPALLLLLFLPSSAGAGAWTQPKGHIWSKLTIMAQSTTEEYVAVGVAGREPDIQRVYIPGERAPYDDLGEYDSRAAFFDLWYGVTDRIDIGVQIPWFRQEFVNDALLIGFGEPRVASGFSDIRGFLKINLVQKPFVGTVKFGFKAPTGEFVNEEGIIPVGEAQWDFDVVGQIGKSLWPLPVYANLDVGYRFRLKNEDIDRDPGNELLFLGEVGVNPRSWALVALKLEGIRGKKGKVLGVTNDSLVKRISYLSPTAVLGPWNNVSFEAAARISLNGRSFPAGALYTIGVQYSGNPFSR